MSMLKSNYLYVKMAMVFIFTTASSSSPVPLTLEFIELVKTVVLNQVDSIYPYIGFEAGIIWICPWGVGLNSPPSLMFAGTSLRDISGIYHL